MRRRPGQLRVGELEVDAAARVVRLRGTPVELSQKEFALVRTLASDPTRVFTKDELLRSVWGFRALGTNRHIVRQCSSSSAFSPLLPDPRERRGAELWER